MENPRCFTLFQEACRSDKTRKTYTLCLHKFLEWGKKDYESLLALSDSELQILLEDYMLYCKKRFKKSGIILRFSAIEKFLFINDRTVNKKKMFMFLPEQLKTKQRAITDDEIREMLLNCGSRRNRVIIHILSATGCRPEALTDLRMRDLEEMPNGCMSVIFYAGTNNEYQHFIHAEVTNAVNDYLDERSQEGELIKPETFLVRKKFFLKYSPSISPLTVHGLESIMTNIMKHSGIKRVKQNEDRFDLPLCGGFRNRFSTILKRNSDVSYVIAEMFLDHKIRLEGHYTFPTKEELFAEYQKVIPELMIDEKERLKQQLKQKKKESESTKGMKKEMADMKKRFDGLEDILKKLSEKD